MVNIKAISHAFHGLMLKGECLTQVFGVIYCSITSVYDLMSRLVYNLFCYTVITRVWRISSPPSPFLLTPLLHSTSEWRGGVATLLRAFPLRKVNAQIFALH